ncbi:MAG: LSM domain-containing protein [Nanoarchaeota archaeon]|nr:LSM domain-containing protein [Nanoarchaeota archaeon]
MVGEKMERPLDALQAAKNKRVLVEVWDGTKYKGILKAFDLNSNIVLEKVELEDGSIKEWMFLRSVFGFVVVG